VAFWEERLLLLHGSWRVQRRRTTTTAACGRARKGRRCLLRCWWWCEPGRRLGCQCCSCSCSSGGGSGGCCLFFVAGLRIQGKVRGKVVATHGLQFE
jgi:hypothetical protein